MEQKKALNRKKLKVILVICIVMIVTAGVGLAVYIHHVDTVTLGRKVSVYRLDVSKLTVGEAQHEAAGETGKADLCPILSGNDGK